INCADDPRMLADKAAFLREGQDEMQEQRGLEQPGRNVAPVDGPVKLVQFSAEFEGVENERDQAEHIEVRGTRRRPASQQDIKADAQVDQGDEPKPEVQRALGGNQDDGRIQRDGLPYQGISRLRPCSYAENLRNRGAVVFSAMLVIADRP